VTNPYHQEIMDALQEGTTPRFSFAAIERRSKSLQKAAGPNKRAAVAAAFLVLVPCLAAAAVIVPPALQQAIVRQLAQWNIKPSAGGTWQMGTAVSLQDLQNSAAFRVVLPSHLPATARLTEIVRNTPGDTSYTLTYQLPQGRKAWFTLQKRMNATAYVPVFIVAKSDDSGRSVEMKKYPAQVWFSGDEVVTLSSDGLTGAQIHAIKAAMNGVDAPLHRGPVR